MLLIVCAAAGCGSTDLWPEAPDAGTPASGGTSGETPEVVGCLGQEYIEGRPFDADRDCLGDASPALCVDEDAKCDDAIDEVRDADGNCWVLPCQYALPDGWTRVSEDAKPKGCLAKLAGRAQELDLCDGSRSTTSEATRR